MAKRANQEGAGAVAQGAEAGPVVRAAAEVAAVPAEAISAIGGLWL